MTPSPKLSGMGGAKQSEESKVDVPHQRKDRSPPHQRTRSAGTDEDLMRQRLLDKDESVDSMLECLLDPITGSPARGNMSLVS